jgi:catalase
MTWDFFSLNPETLHQLLFLMSDRGTPCGYRHMHGYGSHTFSMFNPANESVWVKFHFRTQQGIKNLSSDEAAHMKSVDMDFAQADLVSAIDKGNFPKWDMYIQVMTNDEAGLSNFNPFDLTKTWSQKEFPLIPVGTLELNEIPLNYFAEVEQAAFAPAHVVDGIGYSPDKMLQARIFAYPDAARYRLGVNYEQIPVNRCPYMVNNYYRDGHMRVDRNAADSPNYYPNSFDDIGADGGYQELPLQLYSGYVGTYDRNAPGEDDHFSQPGEFYREVLSPDAKASLVKNIVGAMSSITGSRREEIINRQLCHFFRADINLGLAIAKGLNMECLLSAHNSSQQV